MHDPARLKFRTDVRPARKSPRSLPTFWLIVAVVGSLALLWVLRGVIASNSLTASRSIVVSPAAAPAEAPDQSIAVESRRSGEWVYKCAGVDGVISFQSQPCKTGEATLDRMLAIRDTPADIARARAKEREAVRRAARMAALAGTTEPGYGTSGVTLMRGALDATPRKLRGMKRSVGSV